MRPPKILQTTTFRLAAIYVAGFALAVAAFGVVKQVGQTGEGDVVPQQAQQIAQSDAGGRAKRLWVA